MVALLAALCSFAVAAPAGAATYGFRITGARMSEVMTFQGDGGPACARAGVCGYSGTVSYGFDHAHGIAAVAIRPRRVVGVGALFFSGLTSASVQAPEGGPVCRDSVLRRFDAFAVEGTPSRIRLVFHPPSSGTDFLGTYCAGPGDADMSHAHAVPEIALSARSLRRKSLLLHASTTRAFHAGPFVGTLAFTVDLRLRRSREPVRVFRIVPIG
jgi:hypothetical protein